MHTINIKLEKSIQTSIVIDNHISKNLNTILKSFSYDTHFVIITDKNVITHYNELIHSIFQEVSQFIYTKFSTENFSENSGESWRILENSGEFWKILENSVCYDPLFNRGIHPSHQPMP